MTLANNIDATFYRLIHELRESERENGMEQRHAERLPFTSTQRIAPLLTPGIPPQEAFFPVRCVNLNRRGLAFVLPAPPSFSRLVIALGKPPEELFVSASVAHSEQVTIDHEGHVHRAADGPSAAPLNGESAYLVGCQFLQRLDETAPSR